jgi:hypothetical protein
MKKPRHYLASAHRQQSNLHQVTNPRDYYRSIFVVAANKREATKLIRAQFNELGDGWVLEETEFVGVAKEVIGHPRRRYDAAPVDGILYGALHLKQIQEQRQALLSGERRGLGSLSEEQLGSVLDEMRA